MSGITPSARFVPVASNLNASAAIAIEPKLPGQVLSVTYSFADTAGKFNPVSNGFQSRVAIIAGRFGDALANFTVAYALATGRILLDLPINDVGPTTLLIPPDAEDGVPIDTDGITVLLAAPVVSGVTGTLFVGKLQVTSRGLVTKTRDVRRNANNATTAATSSTSSGSNTGSGGSGGGGGATGGGGGNRIRPL